ncbi:hypothetical protein U9M48_004645 [Paspalum notatum var. saurae]|uniref:Rx N-terminal domain-containing protein n=1 Tax=Paspalum notatum var. saurae TaxID=547442 RepID=A0AAQ3PK96_PASNO
MADAVIGMLISKLSAAIMNEAATYVASLLCKEASTLKPLFGKIRKAEGELEIMKAYLHDSKKLKDTMREPPRLPKLNRVLSIEPPI